MNNAREAGRVAPVGQGWAGGGVNKTRSRHAPRGPRASRWSPATHGDAVACCVVE